MSFVPRLPHIICAKKAFFDTYSVNLRFACSTASHPCTVLQEVQFVVLKRRGNIFGNFNDFLAILSLKITILAIFIFKNSQKLTKLVVLVAKNHQNLKKILR